MIVEYEIRLIVTRAVDADEDSTCPAAKRQLEREVLLCLRKLDGDCDCEVMDAVLREEE